MRIVSRLLLTLAMFHGALSANVASAAEKRFALLIGNQSYDASVGALKNPHNDIALIGDALKKQGFEVLTPVKDAKRSAILGAVRELTGKLNVAGPGAVGFLYYSGHGAAEKDTNVNYLIPVDAKDPGTATFWDESVKLDDVLRLLDGARSAVKFVVFDACRNELQMPTRDTSKGLVPVAEQQGMFVAFASAPGRTASDRGEKSGPYAAALAREFGRTGLDHLNLFQNVKEAVISSTSGAQHPWESNGLSRRIYLTGEPTTPADIALWDSVRTSPDAASLHRYLERFPKGVVASTALLMIERLNAEQAQRKAAEQFEIERKALDAKQAAELRAALDDARRARETATRAEQHRAAAEAALAASAKSIAAATADRDAAAAREADLRQAQRKLEAAAVSPGVQSTAEREAAADMVRKLQGAVDELRKAREAVAAEEAKREAAQRAAAEARRTAATAAGARDDATTDVAAAPPLPSGLQEHVKPPGSGPFAGGWVVSLVSENCYVKKGRITIHVDNQKIAVMGIGGSGTIVPAGAFRFTHPAVSDKRPIDYAGVLRGEEGSGTYRRRDGGCGGTFTVRRL